MTTNPDFRIDIKREDSPEALLASFQRVEQGLREGKIPVKVGNAIEMRKASLFKRIVNTQEKITATTDKLMTEYLLCNQEHILALRNDGRIKQLDQSPLFSSHTKASDIAHRYMLQQAKMEQFEKAEQIKQLEKIRQLEEAENIRKLEETEKIRQHEEAARIIQQHEEAVSMVQQQKPASSKSAVGIEDVKPFLIKTEPKSAEFATILHSDHSTHSALMMGIRNNVEDADMVFIDSSGKPIAAHSLFFQHLPTIMARQGHWLHESPDKKQKNLLIFDFSHGSKWIPEKVINYYLNFKYGIPQLTAYPTHSQLLFLADRFQDDELFSSVACGLTDWLQQSFIGNSELQYIFLIENKLLHENLPHSAELRKNLNGIKKAIFNQPYSRGLIEKERSFGNNSPFIADCLGCMYLTDGTHTLEEAMALFQEAADAGDDMAQCHLAECFLTKGKEVEAISWFEKAAQAGSSEALFRLSQFYDGTIPNQTVKKNIEVAGYFLLEAAKNDHLEAQYKLFFMLGREIPYDKEWEARFQKLARTSEFAAMVVDIMPTVLTHIQHSASKQPLQMRQYKSNPCADILNPLFSFFHTYSSTAAPWNRFENISYAKDSILGAAKGGIIEAQMDMAQLCEGKLSVNFLLNSKHLIFYKNQPLDPLSIASIQQRVRQDDTEALQWYYQARSRGSIEAHERIKVLEQKLGLPHSEQLVSRLVFDSPVKPIPLTDSEKSFAASMDEAQEHSHLKTMVRLRNDATQADMVLIAEDGTEIPAHSLLLSASQLLPNSKKDFERERKTNPNAKLTVHLNEGSTKFSASVIHNALDVIYGFIHSPEALSQEKLLEYIPTIKLLDYLGYTEEAKALNSILLNRYDAISRHLRTQHLDLEVQNLQAQMLDQAKEGGLITLYEDLGKKFLKEIPVSDLKSGKLPTIPLLELLLYFDVHDKPVIAHILKQISVIPEDWRELLEDASEYPLALEFLSLYYKKHGNGQEAASYAAEAALLRKTKS